MTTTTTTTAAAGSAASIVKTLGTGSGIDTVALVTGLVEAQFAVKNAALTKRADTLTAQISSVAKLKSGITGFDAALKTLVKGGTLATTPTTSAAAVVQVSRLEGARLDQISTRLEVTQLAAAQAATTRTAVTATSGFASATLTLKVGAATGDAGARVLEPRVEKEIAVPAGATLSQVAALINAQTSDTGVVATIVNDGNGQRLTLKSSTGAANAFTVEVAGTAPTAGENDPASLGVSLNPSGPDGQDAVIGTEAADALVRIDGATFTRASNSVTDLVPGVKLQLQSIGSSQLGSSAPTENLAATIADFVATFNELHAVIAAEIDPADGALRGDPTVTAASRALARLSTTALVPAAGAAPVTLAELGVRTARDGTLSLDEAQLNTMVQRFPAQVEAMFAATTSGLPAALGSVAARVTDRTAGFDVATARYNKLKSGISDQQTKATSEAEAMKTRLTAQFAAMDARVAAYKATQTFLDNQIKAWNRSDD